MTDSRQIPKEKGAGGGRFRLLSFNQVPHLERTGREDAISAA